MLLRLSSWCFRNPRKTVAAWVVVLVAALAAAGAVGPSFLAELQAPESDSRRGFEVLEEHFGGLGSGLSGSIVFYSAAGVDDPAVRAAMEEMFEEVASHEGVTVSSPYLVTIPIPETPPQHAPHLPHAPGRPQVSADGLVAFARIDLAPDLDFNDSSALGAEFIDVIPELPGLQVEIGGEALSEFEPPQSEFIGLAFAIVVLILAFGSVMAMGLPLAVAVAGVGVGLALTVVLSNVLSIPEFATTIGAMVGIGVGIDYALFIVTRYRDGLAEDGGVEPSAFAAFDTAGRAVIFAGFTVVISLLGMLLMGLPFITGLAVAAAVTVAATMIASVTLLPALMAFARDRIEITRWRGLVAAACVALALLGLGLGFRPLLLGVPLALVVLLAGFVVRPLRAVVPRRPRTPLKQTAAYRWSRLVQAHPWIALLVGAALLLAMAAPARSLQLGFADDGNFPEGTTTRRAYDLLADGFGPGFNGPLIVTAEVHDAQDRAAVGPLIAALGAEEGVVSVNGPLPNNLEDPANASAYMVQVFPATSPQDPATAELVDRLRADVIPAAVAGSALEASVTGIVGLGVDFTDYLAGRTPVFFAAVLVLSFILLMIVFRSVLVPLKAVVMNLLSIAAAYGIVVLVFQEGWLGSVIGVDAGPIEPFIPMMLFAIVFGLSMDYEVFLLSRVREEYDRSGDAFTSVADGLASTARVITAAAAIMVVVFGSFVFEDNRGIKMFGLGLAVAVFLDATIVRLLLVPAAMELLGKRNWWVPSWLDRVLPRLTIEHARELEPVPVGAGSHPGLRERD
ncbi:MAG: MMPL family transporter [Chloroflexi bacterium]|nr:MMPL family transporter [Chloroflexota bacterium]